MVDSKKDVIATVILVLINFITYVDRYSIAGVLTKVQHFYKIDDTGAGAIQTTFLVLYVLCSPIFGYLGDRYNRKYLVLFGFSVWLVGVNGASFIPEELFPLFITFRALIGLSEAIFSSISATLVADMFSVKYRGYVFMVLFIAIPVGCGCGFAFCPLIAELTGSFQWAIRIPGLIGFLIYLSGFIFLHEPVRGVADGTTGDKVGDDSKFRPTYVLTALAFMNMSFATGSVNWWTISLLEHSEAWKQGLNSTKLLNDSEKTKIGLYFGGINVAGGLLGIATGVILAGWILKGFCCLPKTIKGRQIVCVLGSLLTAPMLVALLQFGHESFLLSMIFIFFIVLFFTFYLALCPDIVTTIVIPQRRTTAFAYIILLSHLFGDASGPLCIGFISDVIRNGGTTPEDKYKSLSSAYYFIVALILLGGVLYFVSSLTLAKDQERFRTELDNCDQNDTEITELDYSREETSKRLMSSELSDEE